MIFNNIRNIKVGGVKKSELINVINIKNIFLNKYAEILFEDNLFTTSEKVNNIKITEISIYKLGLINGGFYNQIINKAKESGLNLCTLEESVHIRLQYLVQKEEKYITIASNKLYNKETFPNGLYLRNLENKLWLRGYVATSDYIWPSDSKFIFKVEN